MAENRLNKGREIIQAFMDHEIYPDSNDDAKARVAKRLWDIHDEGYAAALRDNGLGA